MARTQEPIPGQEMYGDLEVTSAVVEVQSLGPMNNDLEKAGFIGSILLALFTLVRGMDILSQNRYAFHKIIGPKLYSVTPAIIAYAVVGLFMLFVSPWFTKVFVNQGAAGMGRLVCACLGWLLIILSLVPLTTALGGLPPVGYTANFFGDVMDPMPSAYGPAGVGLVLLLGARFAARMRLY